MLSIIIPTREEERAIETTIKQFDSLQIPHEIIVADSGSKDGTVELSKALGARVVTYDDLEPTAGKNRNRGASIATGDYLVFIDCGVHIPEPERFFAHALSQFSKRPRLVGITGPQYASPAIATTADRISFFIFNLGIRFQNNVLHKGEASGKFMMVTRAAYIAVGGLREDIHTREDGDFFDRIAKQGNTYYDPSLVVYHDARRAHAIGWVSLWSMWIANSVSFMLTGKVLARDWKPIR